MHILLFLLVIKTFIQQTFQNITIHLKESFESFDLHLRILPPDYKTVQFELDLTTPYLWITSFPFKPNSNNLIPSYNQTEIVITHNITYNSQPYLTSFYLTTYYDQAKLHFNNSIFLYHIISNKTIPYFDSFPLAHSFTNPNLNSPIHFLYENKTISSKSFSIEFDLHTHNTKLHIGNITEFYVNKYKYSITIKPLYNINYNNYWLIDFTEIYIENRYNKNINKFIKKPNEIAYLQSNKDSIKVPYEFFTYVKEIIFKKYIEKNICYLLNKYNNIEIECDCMNIYNFPIFGFIISNYKIKLGFDDLFRKYNSETTKCAFVIKHYFNNNNSWLFGIPFLSAHPTIFNYETDTITLYNNNSIYETILSSSSSFHLFLINILFYNIFLCFIGTIFLFYIKLLL